MVLKMWIQAIYWINRLDEQIQVLLDEQIQVFEWVTPSARVHPRGRDLSPVNEFQSEGELPSPRGVYYMWSNHEYLHAEVLILLSQAYLSGGISVIFSLWYSSWPDVFNTAEEKEKLYILLLFI